MGKTGKGKKRHKELESEGRSTRKKLCRSKESREQSSAREREDEHSDADLQGASNIRSLGDAIEKDLVILPEGLREYDDDDFRNTDPLWTLVSGILEAFVSTYERHGYSCMVTTIGASR